MESVRLITSVGSVSEAYYVSMGSAVCTDCISFSVVVSNASRVQRYRCHVTRVQRYRCHVSRVQRHRV